ncbi:MAG: hypothetical protein K6E11_02460 [Bacilli bacterium]|nr:hypothetical protein [Bacilli bacterium]
MAKKEKYVYPKKPQPIFGFVKFILRLFIHKPKIINLNDEYPSEALIIAPHRGKWGPMFMHIHAPIRHGFIGAYQMLGTYKERFHYLRDVLYMQKLHRKKFPSTLKAAFEAIFSKGIYRGMHLIPSYDDIRFINTINLVGKNLKIGLPIVVFPEDSNKGYDDELRRLNPGFVKIVETYNRRNNCDLPIYPMYQHLKKKIIVIDKPFYLSELKGKSNEEICEYSLKRINKLYHEYIAK